MPRFVQFILKGNRCWLLLAGFAILLFIVKTTIVSTSAQGELNKRVIDNTVPSHVPLKIKLKKDKEEKKDRENKNWAADLELEVTNTSNKPIYFLKLYILMPEILSPSGAETGFPLSHGRHEFIYPETRPVAEDIPIRPGETLTFAIPYNDQKGWERCLQRSTISSKFL